MLTWQAPDGHGFEGVRFHAGAGASFRALGRIVRAEPGGEWTASYRLVVGEDGAVERVSITSASADREHYLTLNRTEDGYWLLDTGSGGRRTDFGGAVDVDLATSAIFTAIPIRRLGLQREHGEHTLPVVVVSLPDLDASLVEQHYRAVSPGEQAVVELGWDADAAQLRVDADGLVIDHPGVAHRYAAPAAATAG